MNGKTGTYRCRKPFALMYRRANGAFCEYISFSCLNKRTSLHPWVLFLWSEK
jgi:hypothetical protein